MRELDAGDNASLVAIQRLQAAYGDAVTRRAWPEVEALFEPDAVVHIDARTRAPFSLDGPRAVVAFIESSLEAFTFFELAILNAVADLTTADTATGRVYICELRHDTTGAWTQAYGLYRDAYVCHDGDWRIARRRYRSLARTGPRIESFGVPTDDP